MIESYIEPFLSCHSDGGDPYVAELVDVLSTGLALLEARRADPDRFARSVDWAAKKRLLQEFASSEDKSWRDPVIQSLDLEYHRIDGDGGLYHALVEQGQVDARPPKVGETIEEDTRARARSIAVRKFRDQLKTASWGTLTFATPTGEKTVHLAPDRSYPATLEACATVEEFIMELE